MIDTADDKKRKLDKALNYLRVLGQARLSFGNFSSSPHITGAGFGENFLRTYVARVDGAPVLEIHLRATGSGFIRERNLSNTEYGGREYGA